MAEDQIKNLKESVNGLGKRVDTLEEKATKEKERKVASRKLWVALIFGFAYPILYTYDP